MDMTVILPGWNSIESVTRWHRGFEIAGFIALGLLLFFEVLTYIYGNRKDTMVAAQQLTPAQWSKQQEEQRQANEHALADLQEQLHKTRQQSGEVAHQLERSKQQVLELQKKTVERSLTADQLSQLDAVLSSNPKYAVNFSISIGDQEALQYANQLIAVLRKNGWTVGGPDQGMYTIPPTGIELTIRDPKDIPPGAPVLANALKQAGIPFRPAHNEGISEGTIEVRVGTKP
jgi:hypothetical protein